MILVCPDCKGEGETLASHVLFSDGSGAVNVPMKCDRCNATGEVPNESEAWIADGKRLKQLRALPYRSLRIEANRRGMSAAELSRMERGVIEPVFPKKGGA